MRILFYVLLVTVILSQHLHRISYRREGQRRSGRYIIMVFSSIVFLFYFLPVVLFLHSLPFKKLKNYILLFASIFFYTWGEPKFVLVLLASIFLNYVLGLLLESKAADIISIKRLFLVFGVITNIGLLFCFKYLNFTFDIVQGIFTKLGLPIGFQLPEIALPIGLSFFTFQGMSYVIDVYRKDVKAQRNPFYLALYISMFPQLIAGPIVRYSDIHKEINERTVSFDDAYYGVQRFIIGLGKKVIIADMLSSVSDPIFNTPVSSLTPGLAWVGIICYYFQIFFDFSGYSDMAIGLGRILGFHFLENFNLPYISKSITEFWRRWHISLGSWFRDYVYIPMGGSRKGNVYLNLFVVFLLTGIWHGATFSFVIWGIWHGLFIVAERFFKNHSKHRFTIPAPVQWIYTSAVVIVGWVFFRANTLSDAVSYLSTMIGIGSFGTPVLTVQHYLNNQVLFTLIAAAFISFGGYALINKCIPKVTKAVPIIKPVFLLAVLFLSVCMVVNGNYSPFIYFRF